MRCAQKTATQNQKPPWAITKFLLWSGLSAGCSCWSRFLLPRALSILFSLSGGYSTAQPEVPLQNPPTRLIGRGMGEYRRRLAARKTESYKRQSPFPPDVPKVNTNTDRNHTPAPIGHSSTHILPRLIQLLFAPLCFIDKLGSKPSIAFPSKWWLQRGTLPRNLKNAQMASPVKDSHI